ncbi:MAG TPA: hypothetical protein VIF60_10120 [Burkholderiaceae bacterium]|jgi:hypothetical protein
MIDTCTLLLQLNDVQQVAMVRAAFIDYALILLERSRETLDAWETVHLANAIGALSLNVHALQQPTSAWLRLALSDIERALMPPAHRPAPDVIRSIQNEWPTLQQLRDAIESIATEIDHFPNRMT